jgi:hypothetical protein
VRADGRRRAGSGPGEDSGGGGFLELCGRGSCAGGGDGAGREQACGIRCGGGGDGEADPREVKKLGRKSSLSFILFRCRDWSICHGTCGHGLPCSQTHMPFLLLQMCSQVPSNKKVSICAICPHRSRGKLFAKHFSLLFYGGPCNI